MNKETPLISIIVPVYNSSKTLERCVKSIVEQSYSNIEIILVDDGSKDNSLNLCNEFKGKDNRIKVVSQANKGVSVARNNGIDQATGEWVCFVDSDDYIDSCYVKDFGVDDSYGEKTLYLQGYQHNYENSIEIQNVHEKSGVYSLPTNSKILFENTNVINQGTVCSKLYNTSVLKQNHLRFNHKMRLNEDNCFFWEYLSLIKTVVINDTCGYHYMHAEGINHSKSHKNYKEYLYITSENKRCLDSLYNFYCAEKGTYYAYNYSQYVSNSWLHALVAFFLDSNRNILEYDEILQWKCELVKYKPRNTQLKFLKFLLNVIFLFPRRFQYFILGILSKAIDSAGSFYI